METEGSAARRQPATQLGERIIHPAWLLRARGVESGAA
jgi:hypothetical protein